MKSWARWLYLIAGLAAAFVAASSIVLAIRQNSWAPIITVGWIPAVIAAAWPGTYHRCLPRRRGPAG
jgi:roadblock/LC7 domain-containing protein